MSNFPQIGSTLLGRYVILDVIGIGGEGAVSKARDEQTSVFVAIKQLACASDGSLSDEQLRRFQRAGALRFGHPNIVDPIECVEDGGEWYLVMPLVEGVDLHMYLQSCGGSCPVDKVIAIIAPLADALDAVHAEGVVHRDIKPLNIMITPDGRPMLIDFGICRSVRQKTISSGGGLGTANWMSPEQTRDARLVDHRSDLFSLGLVLYFLLTGVPPVQASDADEATRIIRDAQFASPRQLNSQVPVELEAICGRLLARLPEHRYQDASQLCMDLARIGHGANHNGCCPGCNRAVDTQASFCSTCGIHLCPPRIQTLCLACGGQVSGAPICATCKRPFGRTRHRFEFTKGLMAGTTCLVPEGIFEVGRDVLCPRDLSISQRHFQMACVNGSAFVQDAGAMNKTLVDGHVADVPLQLRPNQVVLIGRSTATYYC